MQPLQLLCRKLLLFLPLTLFSSICISQVTEEWVKRYNGLGNSYDFAQSMAVDAKGNVYVTGTSNGDYTTIKYDAAGNELWVKINNGPGGGTIGIPQALAVDANGNVYVTGTSHNDSTGRDYATIKYDPDGKELWVKRYHGPGIYYTDDASSMAVDANGNVYVTGISYGEGTNWEWATVKYDATGKELWVRRYNGTVQGGSGPSSIAVDADGNVYLTGTSLGEDFFDYTTIKYDKDGNKLWVKTYNGPSNDYDDDASTSLAVDNKGNVYVTGVSYSGENTYLDYDYATIKYDAEGNELWVKRYNGPGKLGDGAISMAVDADGNVYVTGSSYGGESTDYDYATIKYDAAGNELWIRRYSGSGNSYDAAVSLALDGSGNVYVTGTSYGEGVGKDYATVKYDVAGNELWVKRYNGPGDSTDYATSMAVDANGNVYITGSSYDSTTNQDFTTIKYSQSFAVAAVTSFKLINTRKDEELQKLKDGDTLDITALPSLNLNIQAHTSPDSVGSVRFQLSGTESRTHTENRPPYALFANNKGDYYPWQPTVGEYTLTATPYALAKGKGQKGTPLTIHFSVVGSAVTTLVLVNAEKDSDLQVIRGGDVIDLSTLPTTKLNIRALTNPPSVGSVVFNLDNKVQVLENHPPYLIGGNEGSNYSAWTLPVGKHRLIATPYERKNGEGKKGVARSVYFTVVDKSSIRVAGNGQLQQQSADLKGKEGSLWVAPNPFREETMLSFTLASSGYTTVEVYDMKGALVQRLFEGRAEEGKVYRLVFQSKTLPAGMYTARVVSNGTVHSTQLLMIK